VDAELDASVFAWIRPHGAEHQPFELSARLNFHFAFPAIEASKKFKTQLKF
jgi:hypothetical protein